VTPNGDASSWTYIQPAAAPTNFLGGGNCPVCGGTGLSPSTQGGVFANEDKDSKVKDQMQFDINELALIEKELGLGGSEISHISKHKVETIGLVMNDFPSIRVDEVGKINNNEVLIFPDGVVTGMKESPLVEYVHVDDLPGGSYTINACNRFNVQTGAGGIKFKSYGPVDLGGTIMNLAGEQINVVSENEINIVAGKRLNVVADILSLRQKNYGQVLVDSNLGVSQNVIIGGGLHVEGELTVQHITAPEEIQETEQTKLYAKPVGAPRIGTCVVGGGSSAGSWAVYGTSADEDSILCYDHSHQFKNLPLHLMKDSDHVRKVAKKTESTQKVPASPVENANKGGGLTATGEAID
jgi:hypothetical protein